MTTIQLYDLADLPFASSFNTVDLSGEIESVSPDTVALNTINLLFNLIIIYLPCRLIEIISGNIDISYFKVFKLSVYKVLFE